MDEYWSVEDESWSLADSGKFELSVVYSGTVFTARFKSEEKCRSDIRERIRKSISLGIIKKERR